MEHQAEHVSPSDHRPPPNRRRDKPQLSCNLCRKRKLKCDRRRPCNRCSSHGIAASCTYPPTRKPDASSPDETSRASDTLQQRLEDLEEQIISLIDDPTIRTIQTPPQSAGHQNKLSTAAHLTRSPTATFGSPPAECATILNKGNLRSSPAGSIYVDASHWTAILDNISELKERVQRHDGNVYGAGPAAAPTNYIPEAAVSAGPQLLFGCNGTSTRDEILAAMPERPVVDRLIFDFMTEGGSLFMACLHIPTFQNQYDKFWEDPSQASLLWLGLLYAIMCLAGMARSASQSARTGDDTVMQQTVRQPRFLNEVVHCLILGDYPSGGPYALETLFYYLCIENARRPDSENGIWVLLGTIIRLAFRMGYHRDPSQLRGVTPFQAEMRRRMWAILYHGETMFSIQAGAPKMIHDSQCDAQPPSNLLDADFDENTVVMPPARNPSESTPVQFTIARFKLAKVLSAIADSGNALEQKPEQVKVVEKALYDAYDELPPPLKMNSGRICFTDTPYSILYRLILGLVFEKCKILLYRRCLDRSNMFEDSGDYAGARDSLINASLKVLEYQVILDRETQSEGILWSTRWKLSSIVLYEFHMAAAVLTTVMYRTMGNCPAVPLPASTQSEIIAALKQSQRIWTGISSRSREAIRSIKMLEALFSKIESGSEPSPVAWDWSSALAMENNVLLDGNTIFYFPL